MWNLCFSHCWSQQKGSNVCYVWTCLLHVPSGKTLSDDMLSLMVLRYGASSGHISLENFISLILRLDCMNSKWSPKVHPSVQGCWKPVLINPAGFSVLQLSVGHIFLHGSSENLAGFLPGRTGFPHPCFSLFDDNISLIDRDLQESVWWNEDEPSWVRSEKN